MTGTLPEPTCKLSWFSDPNSCSYMRIFCNQCGYIGRTERLDALPPCPKLGQSVTPDQLAVQRLLACWPPDELLGSDTMPAALAVTPVRVHDVIAARAGFAALLREREALRAALADTVEVIGWLADQQAMPDDSWMPARDAARALLTGTTAREED